MMIYGVSFSEDLVNALVRNLIDEYTSKPFQLAQIQIVLPTKRACIEVKQAFLNLLPKEGLLLPKLTSLYELDVLDESVPPALSNLERVVLLSKLCRAKPHVASYDQAVKMAISLSELLDLSYQYDLNLSQISQLVQIEKFATHWQQTIQFLDILSIYWPQILKEKGKIDPMDRSIRLIRSFTKKIQEKVISGPIVLAGFTKVFPAISELIDAVGENKDNLILIDNYIAQDESIPYYTDLHRPQEKVIIEALTKDAWDPISLDKDSFNSVKLIHADNTTEEALAIALILREVLETPKQTGILVTTDRTLARQVVSQMKRWGIHLDDSAGTPLNHTEEGIFFELIARLGLDPSNANYLGLLKHPLAADKRMPAELHQLVEHEEKIARLHQESLNILLNTNLTSWIQLFQNNILRPFEDILKKHIGLAECLATSLDKTASERLWNTQYGHVLFKLLNELLDVAPDIGEIETQTYPEILKLFMAQISVRPKYGMHPRLDILGPIEARFHHADVCVIGGLNEGTFPPLPDVGPWFNRPMRVQLGLPLPEFQTQELAMDFAHNFCSSKVYLTRARKVDGAQTVISRFISRIKVVSKINNQSLPEYQAHLTKLLETPTAYDPTKRPMPCPPIAARPIALPVTQIEMWRRNPYAIYARYILQIKPLLSLDNPNKNAEYGSLIHKVIQTFLTENPHSLDKEKLIRTAEHIFDTSSLNVIDKLLFKIKFQAIADFIIEQQNKDLSFVKESVFEEKLEYSFSIDHQPFTLYGIADRIDSLTDGTFRIIDYKTYSPPTIKEVKAGYAPQLSLEALLLRKTTEQEVSTLAYWYLTDRKENSENDIIVDSVQELEDLLQKTEKGLFEMVRAYRNEKIPYEVCPIPSQAPQYNDYAHLARMQEWAFEEE